MGSDWTLLTTPPPAATPDDDPSQRLIAGSRPAPVKVRESDKEVQPPQDQVTAVVDAPKCIEIGDNASADSGEEGDGGDLVQ